jgi:hypothetical protein
MFATAVAISSANSSIHASVPAGIGSGRRELMIIAPQTRPATTIGPPTADWASSRRPYSAMAPVAFA